MRCFHWIDIACISENPADSDVSHLDGLGLATKVISSVNIIHPSFRQQRPLV